MGIGDDLQKEETEIYPRGKKKKGAKGNNIGLTSLSLPLKEKKKVLLFRNFGGGKRIPSALAPSGSKYGRSTGTFFFFLFSLHLFEILLAHRKS